MNSDMNKFNVTNFTSLNFETLSPKTPKCSTARIIDFTISSDSVVAKAIVVTDNTARRIEIDWGDGDKETINRRPGFKQAELQQLGDENSLPSGTYEFYHRYDVQYVTEEFGGIEVTKAIEYDHFASLRIDDNVGGVDFQVKRISISPRYRITRFPMYAWIISACDHSFESEHEFRITQQVDGALINEWLWNPPVGFITKAHGIVLDGSMVQRDVGVEFDRDLGTLVYSFDFTEKDYWYDDVVRIPFFIGSYYNGEEEELYDTHSGSISRDGCRIYYEFKSKVKLLVPLPVDSSTVYVQS